MCREYLSSVWGSTTSRYKGLIKLCVHIEHYCIYNRLFMHFFNFKVYPNSEKEKYVIKARICRNVDGMDLLLFEKTVSQTRQFIQVQLQTIIVVGSLLIQCLSHIRCRIAFQKFSCFS